MFNGCIIREAGWFTLLIKLDLLYVRIVFMLANMVNISQFFQEKQQGSIVRDFVVIFWWKVKRNLRQKILREFRVGGSCISGRGSYLRLMQHNRSTRGFLIIGVNTGEVYSRMSHQFICATKSQYYRFESAIFPHPQVTTLITCFRQIYFL